MKIEIWSDVVCPWCYVGKRRFDAAWRRFEHRDRVEVIWRAFELDPHAPAERSSDYPGHLSSKYGVPREQAEEMISRMVATGSDVGVRFRFDIARPGNTFDAHRLVHLAGLRKKQDAVVNRLFAATFEEGRPVGDRTTLMELGVEAGLDLQEVRKTLDSGAYAQEVRADEAQARAYGITGVPFFVVDRTYGVSGAQPSDVLQEVLEDAWHARHGPAEVPRVAASAPGCEDDNCAV